MHYRLALTLTLTALAAAAPPADAAIVHVTVPDVAARGGVARAARWHRLPAVPIRAPFSLVGVSWLGAPGAAFLVRTRAADGRVGRWLAAEVEPAARAGRRHVTEPLWVGPSTRLEVRVRGAVRRVRLALVDPGADPPAVAAPLAVVPRANNTGGVPMPTIVSRAGWGADESLRRNSPAKAGGIRLAIVHHTSGANTYTQAQAAAVVRGIYEYHTRELGWNDIGYNALVDRYGTIYEGRAGGLTANIVGAHALGFNTGTFGLSLIGNFEPAGSTPPDVQVDAAVRMLAWRLDVAHVDPLAYVTVTSGGSDRWKAGTRVRLATISGHRDTLYTDCPGQNVYAMLPQIRKAVRDVPGTRIWDPVVARVTANGVTGLHATARLSAAVDWRLDLVDASGAVVATRRGTGTAIDWSGDDVAGASGWRLSAPGARAAVGGLSGAAPPDPDPDPVDPPDDPDPDPVDPPDPPDPVEPPAFTSLASLAGAITPNGDGLRDTGGLRIVQGAAGTLRVVVEPAAGGATVAVLLATRAGAAGDAVTVPWDGTANGIPVPSGHYRYRVRLARAAGGDPVVQTVKVDLRRELDGLRVTPAVSPNADGLADALVTRVARAADGPVTLRLVAGRRVLRVLAQDMWVPAGTTRLIWDVGDLPDGAYAVEALAPGAGGVQALSAPTAVDRAAPVVSLVAATPTDAGLVLRLAASEPVTFHLRSTAGVVFRGQLAAGTVAVVVPADVLAGRRMRLYYRDRTGTAGKPAPIPRSWD